MNTRLIIHCDKCDSQNVLHEQVIAPPQEVHKTMSEVAAGAGPKMELAVYYYTQYRMVCKDCGHIVRYQE